MHCILYKHVCNHHNQYGYLGLSPHNFGQYPLNPMPNLGRRNPIKDYAIGPEMDICYLQPDIL